MFLFINLSLIEKLARERSAKSEAKTNEEPEPSTKEDDATATDPNDLEQTEKVPNPDEEEEQPQQSQTPNESSSPPQQSQTPNESSSPPPPADSSPPPAVPSPPLPPTEVHQEDLRGLSPEDEKTQVAPIREITADHPEVKKAVEQAVEEARNAAVNIPPDVYAELIHKAIQTIEQEQREKDPNGPL